MQQYVLLQKYKNKEVKLNELFQQISNKVFK